MKKVISLQFSKAVNKYEDEIVVQKLSALEIKKLIGNINGTGIDLGCGTGLIGDITKRDLIGIDISYSMIKRFLQKYKTGLVADIENLPFKDKSFDYAVSNFSLHWTDLRKSVPEIGRILKNQGYLVLSIPVKDSFQIIKSIVGYETFLFPEEKEIIGILSEHFFIKDQYIKHYTVSFENPIDLLKHLKKTGTTASLNGKTLGKKIKNYKKFVSYKGKPILNFKVLFIKAIRINTI